MWEELCTVCDGSQSFNGTPYSVLPLPHVEVYNRGSLQTFEQILFDCPWLQVGNEYEDLVSINELVSGLKTYYNSFAARYDNGYDWS